MNPLICELRNVRRRRGGYVLVVTIMLLAVTALIVTSISRHSLFQATTAKLAKTNLQEKWAVVSCQRFCLTNGNRILSTIDDRKFRLSVWLSGMLVHNEINDESAKLDVNSLSGEVSREELSQVIKDAVDTSQFMVRLRPLSTAAGDATRRSYESWGQIFVARHSDSYVDLRVASENLTCWGNRLNFHNADRDILRTAIKSVAGSIMADRFLSELTDNATLSLTQLLEAIEANETQSEKLTRLLSDRSWGTSVWTDVVGDNRLSSYFAVQQRPIENLFRYHSFQWQ